MRIEWRTLQDLHRNFLNLSLMEMDHGRQKYVVFQVVYFLAVNLTLSLLVMQSDGRYLRPADHGLSYQDTSEPTKETVPEMLSFFNNGKRVAIPEAKNLTGTGTGASDGEGFSSGSDQAAEWWKNRERQRSRDAHRSHVREILLVTSFACGLAGVVLLAVSAFLFILRYRKQRSEEEVQRSKESKERSLSTSVATSSLPLAIDK